MQCRDVLAVDSGLKIETYAEKGSSEEFDYLETLMHSLYNSLVFEFRVKRFDYKGLDGLKLTAEETVKIMVQLLNHRYTHVTQESLDAGWKAFESYEVSGRELSSSEKLAKALILLHWTKKRASGVAEALALLEEESSSQALWHRAEIHYKSKEFVEAEEFLLEIEARGEESVKLTEALSAVEVSAKGGSFQNLMTETGFDHSQWGPY